MNSTRRRRWRILLVLVALYAVLGFFALPHLIKWQIEKRGPALLGRPVSVGAVRVNPFTLSTTLERVTVRTVDGTEPFAGWGRLFVNFDAIGSMKDDWELSEISLEGFHGAIAIEPDGSLNFSDLIERFRAPANAPKPTERGRPWLIRKLTVANARVDFADRSAAAPFRSEIGPVNFTIVDFRTIGVRGAPGRFEAVTESGEKFTWLGTLTTVPLTSAGELRVENLLLAKYAPYLAERLKAKIADGRLSLTASYDVDLSPETRRVVLNDGTVQLQGLRLTTPEGDRPLVDVSALDVTGIAADALVPRVTVDAIRWNGGRVAIERDADGAINLLQLWPGTGGPAQASSGAKPLDATVREIAVRDVRLEVRDQAAGRPVELAVAQVNALVRGATLRPNAAMPVELAFTLEPRGTVKVTGNLTREPLLAEVDVDMAQVALAPFSPYLENKVGMALADGVAGMRGHVRLALAENAPADVTFAGEARLENLRARTPEGGEFAGVGELAATDVKLATAPRMVLSVGEVRVGAPFARVVRAEDGALNLAALPGDKDEGGTLPTEGSGGPRPELSVTRVLIERGDFSFEDRSVQPAVRMALSETTGTLRNFSSQRPELGTVELRTTVNGTGPVTVLGRLNPLPEQPFADLRVDAREMDLRPAAAYVEKYAGYALEGGTLFLDTQARLANDRLDLRNTVTLEQFTLGEQKPGPDAVKLPVKFGVALLKDANGRIVLELPVSGSLADPQFAVGKVVGDVVTNVLKKAATSPFALLGSMFGGGGEELAQQDFVPGEATLRPESLARVATLQRALAARPALTLEIEGGYDPAADGEGLQRTALERLLQREFAISRGQGRDLNADTPAQPVPEDLREPMLRRVFAARFPESAAAGTPRALPLPPALATEPPPAPRAEERGEPEVSSERATEPERRSLFGRAWDLATLKGPRDWWDSRRERARAEEAEKARRAEQAQIAARAADEARQRAAQQAAVGVRPEVPVAEMERVLLASMEVTPEDLRRLAEARAQRVRELIMADGKVPGERLKLVAVKPETAQTKGARTVVQLR